jgi:hypothetical protein
VVDKAAIAAVIKRVLRDTGLKMPQLRHAGAGARHGAPQNAFADAIHNDEQETMSSRD